MSDASGTEEVVDGLPVPAQTTSVEIGRAPASVPARQAAALTATGFVAGVATAAVVSRRRSRMRLLRFRRRIGPLCEIFASNSTLVFVQRMKGY